MSFSIFRLIGNLIPRFVTEDICVDIIDGAAMPRCVLRYVKPGSRYDGVATVKLFSWLGHSIPLQTKAGVRAFVNPHNTKEVKSCR